eukprot:CAMPEP_0196825450 /NCGR_PEP_ID=MMETSP1362-20130617/93059_1 /TAXON_ID=163516 /ORGANISM="Leptocylindrus danicus, Strain CCMP1856" /LENGTH=132 /DNA_ID=CAMNT_0042205873 /DNA_START=1017 /DNA_END=1414 /DNA_ORIENTATION=-
MIKYEQIEEKHFYNRREWDGQEYSWDFLTPEWRTSTADLEHRWMTSCTRLFLEWGRACWSHYHNSLLYGPPKQQHQQKQQRIQAEARVWLEAAKKRIPGATSEERPLQERHNQSDDRNDQHMATTATNIETA